jgi:PilZ domain-containing protein
MPSKFFREKRRDLPRLPARMEACIVAPVHGSLASCVVREVSPAGAKLEVDDDWFLPEAFWLRIVGDTGMHFCKVAWRHGASVGVNFVAGHDHEWWKQAQPSKEGGTNS